MMAQGKHPQIADLNTVTRLATKVAFTGRTLMVEDRSPGRLERMRDFNPELRRRAHDVIASEFEGATAAVREQFSAVSEIAGRLVQAKAMSGDEVFEIVELNRMPSVRLADPPRRMGA